MRVIWTGAVGVIALAGCLLLSAQGGEPAKSLILHARLREAEASGRSFAVKEKTLEWDPAKTAIIICDMWNQHWCKGATRRVGELAPAMNRAVAAARDKGVLIIHAPSSCMDAYKDHPARKRAEAAPKAANLPDDIGGWCNKIPAEEKGVYPIDQSDGGCDDGPQCPAGLALEVADRRDRDPATRTPSATRASRSGTCWKAAGITNVMLMGVHTNMCVLGRPFGLRQLARHGKNVVLVRDLTDTMYNSRSWPYVSHFEGTNRIIEHIEKYVCPTIVSTDLTGQPAVRVPARQSPPRRVLDRRRRVQDRDRPCRPSPTPSSSRWACAARS